MLQSGATWYSKAVEVARAHASAAIGIAQSSKALSSRVPGAVIGGLDQWTALKDGTPDDARAQAEDAIAQTRGIGLVLGAGCVLLPGSSDIALVELVKSVGGQPRLGLIKPQ